MNGKLPENHPLVVAWEDFKKTFEFSNVKNLAINDKDRTNDCLWHIYAKGWKASLNPNNSHQRLKIALWGDEPRVGKDTIGKIIQDNHNFLLCNFKKYLVRDAYDYLKQNEDTKLTFDEWLHIINDDHLKDNHILFDDVTPRQYIIKVSHVMKIVYGDDRYANFMKHDLKQFYDSNVNICVTDLRYRQELDMLISEGFTIVKVIRSNNPYRIEDDSLINYHEFNEFTDYLIYNNEEEHMQLKTDINNLIESISAI